MSDELVSTQAGEASPNDTGDHTDADIVRRRRSSHHHHHHGARHRSPRESETINRRRMDMMAILYIAPSLLMIIGGILWVISHLNPEASMRPKGIIELSNIMLGIGGAFFLIALLIDWARRLQKHLKDKRERQQHHAQAGRRRSAHHRHRHPQDS